MPRMQELTSLKVLLAKSKTEKRLDLIPRYYEPHLCLITYLSPTRCPGRHLSGML